jgi:hypothetical protein
MDEGGGLSVDKDAAAIVGEFEGLVRIKDESLYHSLS